MDSALLLATSPCVVLESGLVKTRNPAKPLEYLYREPEKGWNWVLLGGKKLTSIFSLLPSFVFSSCALKKLLIIISVQFEMQAL